mmetsp:Transcript_34564/g.86833  ORF Transcript_34564/g.86833 Transcript_34564/m.86833 type:complete len:337 (+) Transcript_34564:51-1061(+)
MKDESSSSVTASASTSRLLMASTSPEARRSTWSLAVASLLLPSSTRDSRSTSLGAGKAHSSADVAMNRMSACAASSWWCVVSGVASSAPAQAAFTRLAPSIRVTGKWSSFSSSPAGYTPASSASMPCARHRSSSAWLRTECALVSGRHARPEHILLSDVPSTTCESPTFATVSAPPFCSTHTRAAAPLPPSHWPHTAASAAARAAARAASTSTWVELPDSLPVSAAATAALAVSTAARPCGPCPVNKEKMCTSSALSSQWDCSSGSPSSESSPRMARNVAAPPMTEMVCWSSPRFARFFVLRRGCEGDWPANHAMPALCVCVCVCRLQPLLRVGDW